MEKSLKLPRRRSRSLEKRKARNGYFFVAPFIIGIILIYIPILIDSIWFSFYEERSATIDGEFTKYFENVGLTYYKKAFSDKEFVAALTSGLQQLVR